MVESNKIIIIMKNNSGISIIIKMRHYGSLNSSSGSHVGKV